MKNQLYLIVALTMICSGAHAQISKFIPTEYQLQFAGHTGFLAAGVGYQITSTYHPTLSFGYVDKNFGGSENAVSILSLKNTFYFNQKPLFKYFHLYGGLSLNCCFTNNTFASLPNYYPDKYYFQNRIHGVFFLGNEMQFTINQAPLTKIGVFIEADALDAYLLESLRTKYVKPHMALSMAIGIKLYLK